MNRRNLFQALIGAGMALPVVAKSVPRTEDWLDPDLVRVAEDSPPSLPMCGQTWADIKLHMGDTTLSFRAQVLEVSMSPREEIINVTSLDSTAKTYEFGGHPECNMRMIPIGDIETRP